MLTDEQVAAYRDDGFLVLRDVVPSDLLAEARAATETLLEASRTRTESDDVYDLEPGHSPDRPRVRRVKNPVLQHQVFDRLMRAPFVLDAVEDLFTPGAGVRLNVSKLNTKTGSGGAAAPVEWHQDFAFYPQTNSDVIAVGVHLDDATLDNGCLMMIPGSHQGPVLDHHHDGVFVGAVDPALVDLGRAVPIEVAAGSLSFHHGHMLHASAPNLSTKPRRLLLFELIAADAWPLHGAFATTDLANFDARLLRGTPTLVPRIESVPARIPLPRPEHSGSIFELQEYARTPPP